MLFQGNAISFDCAPSALPQIYGCFPRALPWAIAFRAFGAEARFVEMMLNYSEKNGCLAFKVRVVPRASRSEVIGEHDGALRVRIAAPPVDGAANEELIRTLAQAFDVSRSAVEIVTGHGSKSKRISVKGGRAERLMELCPATKSR